MELDKNIIVSQIKSYFSKSKKVDFPSLISYTTNIKSVDYYKLLDNNKNNVFNNKIFWEQDYNSMSFCALGHEINYNNQKYSKETINNKIIKEMLSILITQVTMISHCLLVGKTSILINKI